MWDDITTIIGIIILLIFGLLGGLLIIGFGILLSPVLIIICLIFSLTYLVDSVINLIRVCKNKPEKHIFNIQLEDGEDKNE